MDIGMIICIDYISIDISFISYLIIYASITRGITS